MSLDIPEQDARKRAVSNNKTEDGPSATGSATDFAIYYPVTVDVKKLTALIITGDAIIRAPNQERIDSWNRIKAILFKQCESP